MLYGLVLIVLAFVIGVTIFMYTAPQFGQIPEGEALERIKKSANYNNNQFQNLIKTEMDMGIGAIITTAYEWFSGGNQKVPELPMPTSFNYVGLQENKGVHVTWFGHSAILLEMAGQRILIDPMLGPASSPVSFLSKRFNYEKPIAIDAIKDIDAIIISHDHYDHLDYYSIVKLIPHTTYFIVPLGVDAHLIKWGVDPGKITALDWWETKTYNGIEFVATPARHFSGRGFADRNKTLWASWVIRSETKSLFFSGDGGYFNGFKEIGEKYGPFDFTMIECGQYNKNWAAIHMMPEESLQAHLDVRGKVMMPIHWGAFNLALHAWNDPVKRLSKMAEQSAVDVYYPLIGQRFNIDETTSQHEAWWKSHK